MSLKHYTPGIEQVCYVGWLLACDASANVAKGIRLLKELDGAEQQQAEHHAIELLKLYNE